jgi:hypothetical protein
MEPEMSDKIPPWFEKHLATVAPELMSSTLFKFKVKLQVAEDDGSGTVRPKMLEINMLPDLELDYENLEQYMQELPAQYAFWAAVYSEVKMGVAVAERKLKMRYGQVMERINKEFEDRKLKPTMEIIKRIVEKDEALAKADLEFQRAQMQAGKLYHMIEALNKKIDLVRSLAGFKKREQYNS